MCQLEPGHCKGISKIYNIELRENSISVNTVLASLKTIINTDSTLFTSTILSLTFDEG